MLVATGYESAILEGIELKPKDREVAQVAERQRSILLPLEDLDRVAVIHPD